jgi:DNA-binding transcriptional ArsR family regulator
MSEIENGIPQRYEKRLKNALAHEIRVDLLHVLEERPSTMRELSEMFDETLSAIAGHMLELWKEGSIEVDGDDAKPLADSRFRITRVLFDSSGWETLSRDERYEATVRILEGMIGEVMGALRSGSIAMRTDEHLTWTPLVVDQRGWTETIEVLNRAFDEVRAINERCAADRRRPGDGEIQMIVAMMGYERGRLRFS